MLQIPRANHKTDGFADLSAQQCTGPLAARGRVEALRRCILSEYASDHSGASRAEMFALTAGCLISNLDGDSFLQLHHSGANERPAPVNACNIKPVPAIMFDRFLKEVGPNLVQQYKEFKGRGATGCTIVSDLAKTLLRVSAGGECSRIESVRYHEFNLVLVENQPYWLDFTFDQFLHYDQIREYSARKPAKSVDYAGVLIMPLDRLSLQFDAGGRLL